MRTVLWALHVASLPSTTQTVSLALLATTVLLELPPLTPSPVLLANTNLLKDQTQKETALTVQLATSVLLVQPLLLNSVLLAISVLWGPNHAIRIHAPLGNTDQSGARVTLMTASTVLLAISVS